MYTIVKMNNDKATQHKHTCRTHNFKCKKILKQLNKYHSDNS